MKMTLLFAWLALGASLGAAKLDKDMRKLVNELSTAYRQAHPDLVSKVGIALLPIANQAEDAKKNRLGEAIEAFVQAQLQQSLVFFVVDRKNTARVLKELSLGESGLVADEGLAKTGQLIGASAFAWGSITAVGDAFHIALLLTEVETGKVLATAAVDIPKRELIEASTELRYSYVAPNGIGLSASSFYLAAPANPLFNKSPCLLADVSVNYRLTRWLMASAGLLFNSPSTGENFRDDQDRTRRGAQPGLPASDTNASWGIIYSPPRYDISQWTAGISLALTHLDLQFTINVAPVLNIGISAGFVATPGNPTMTVLIGSHESEGLFYRGVYADRGDSVTNGMYFSQPLRDRKSLTYLFDFAVGGKVQVRPEFFITPRLAVHAVLGYLLMAPAQVREAHATHASWFFYDKPNRTTWVPDPAWNPHSRDGSMAKDSGEQEASYIYYGFNPLLMPDGKRWTLDLSGLYWQVGAAFFF